MLSNTEASLAPFLFVRVNERDRERELLKCSKEEWSRGLEEEECGSAYELTLNASFYSRKIKKRIVLYV